MPRRKRDQTDNWDNWGNLPPPSNEWNASPHSSARRFPWQTILVVLGVGFLAVGGVVLLGQRLEGPAAAARRFALAAAAIDGNELAERTCEARQMEVLEAGFVITALSAIAEEYVGIGMGDIDTDINDLHFETMYEGAGEAEVHVNGEIRSAFLFISIPIVIDEYWLMAREDGRWKWCGQSRVSGSP